MSSAKLSKETHISSVTGQIGYQDSRPHILTIPGDSTVGVT